MNLIHKLNIANKTFRSLILKEIPNYAIVYVDGRCNMHCDFCCYAAMDARNTSNISPSLWGKIFQRAKRVEKNSIGSLTLIPTRSFFFTPLSRRACSFLSIKFLK